MPVIFASALASIPGTIGGFFPNLYNAADHPFAAPFLRMFSTTGWVYAAIYLLLIIAFNYFYVAMQYNPVEIANNPVSYTHLDVYKRQAKKSVANFKLREGMPIGAKVTLRGERMYEFVDRFFSVAPVSYTHLHPQASHRHPEAVQQDGRGSYEPAAPRRR